MCYFPLGLLKFIVGFGAIASIVVSIALLVLTFYVNFDKKDILNNIGGKVVTDALIGLYLTAAIFMVLGICGVYGAMKSKKESKGSGNCLLFLYFIGVILFFLVFLGGTIFFFVGPHTIFGTECTNGSKTDLIKNLYLFEQKAFSEFGNSTDCPIFYNNSDTYLKDALVSKIFTTDAKDISKINYQGCLTNETKEDTNLYLLGSIEELLDCGGWCNTSNHLTKYSKFSNINNCVSEDCLKNRPYCYDEFNHFLNVKGQFIGFICGAATLLCFMNLIVICCICTHPNKKKSKSNFYEKMMGDD